MTTLNVKNMTSGTLTIIEKLGGDMFKNMKFEVNGNLDEIVAELEKRGYKKHRWSKDKAVCIWAYQDGEFIIWDRDMSEGFTLTTLAELKEM